MTTIKLSNLPKWHKTDDGIYLGDGRVITGLSALEETLIVAAPAMLLTLGAMCERPNAPATVDIMRVLEAYSITLEYT